MPRSRLCMALEGTPPGWAQLALLTAAGMAIGSVATSLATPLSSGEVLGSTLSRVPGRISSFLPVIGSSSLSATPEHPARARANAARSTETLFIAPSRLGLEQRLQHRRHDLRPLPHSLGCLGVGGDLARKTVGIRISALAPGGERIDLLDRQVPDRVRLVEPDEPRLEIGRACRVGQEIGGADGRGFAEGLRHRSIAGDRLIGLEGLVMLAGPRQLAGEAETGEQRIAGGAAAREILEIAVEAVGRGRALVGIDIG